MDFEWTQQAPGTQPAQQTERKGYDPLPPGEYGVIISDQKTKPNKAGTGEYLELTLVIEEGGMKGRRIWDRHNLRNPSQKAVEIARASVDRIREVTGIAARSAGDLVGARMRVITANDDFGAKVTKYLPALVKPEPAHGFDDTGLPF